MAQENKVDTEYVYIVYNESTDLMHTVERFVGVYTSEELAQQAIAEELKHREDEDAYEDYCYVEMQKNVAYTNWLG